MNEIVNAIKSLERTKIKEMEQREGIHAKLDILTSKVERIEHNMALERKVAENILCGKMEDVVEEIEADEEMSDEDYEGYSDEDEEDYQMSEEEIKDYLKTIGFDLNGVKAFLIDLK